MITVEAIQTATATHYGLALIEMRSDRRARTIARPRQVAMLLCRELTTCSLPAIGRQFGNRDHTTVMHACRVVEERAKHDRGTRKSLNYLRAELMEAEQAQ
jgi:chromosomal replication initiator protein